MQSPKMSDLKLSRIADRCELRTRHLWFDGPVLWLTERQGQVGSSMSYFGT